MNVLHNLYKVIIYVLIWNYLLIKHLFVQIMYYDYDRYYIHLNSLALEDSTITYSTILLLQLSIAF